MIEDKLKSLLASPFWYVITIVTFLFSLFFGYLFQMEPFYDRIMNFIRIETAEEEKANNVFQKGVLLFAFGIALIVSLIFNDMKNTTTTTTNKNNDNNINNSDNPQRKEQPQVTNNNNNKKSNNDSSTRVSDLSHTSRGIISSPRLQRSSMLKRLSFFGNNDDSSKRVSDLSHSSRGILGSPRLKRSSIPTRLSFLGSSVPKQLSFLGGFETNNSAFVIVKPHANTAPVRQLIEQKLKESKITIVSRGDILGPTIDRKKLIDQHYYTIASKAMLLSPKDVPVPVSKFQSHFGESWQTVLRDNRAANALQACARFNCSPAQLDNAWQKCDNVIKFGGGLYCGYMTVNNDDDDDNNNNINNNSENKNNPLQQQQYLYVFNAFFMAMRSEFVGESSSIHYYEVKWTPSALSWEDFRRRVIGTTDSSTAAEGSIRQQIYETYESLGLKEKPNKSDNGVHGSASPLEGLAEKANWLGIQYKDDPFGKLVLKSGISKETLDRWCRDPRVNLQSGRKGSVFDALEDTDADDCLELMTELNSLQDTNSAFLFVKPHANTKAVQQLVKDKLTKSNITIVSRGDINGTTIDKQRLIDKHYYSIASKATLLHPKDMPVPKDQFFKQFGEPWEKVVSDRRAVNAAEACARFRCSPSELNRAWAVCDNVAKFGGGFYCGKLTVVDDGDNDDDHPPMLYVFNAFFMEMRSKFVGDSNNIHYYEVKWSPSELSWSDFRGKVVGSTDPSEAADDSIRQQILFRYSSLGLKSKPNKGDNGVHASASPFEGLAEKVNWLGLSYEDDPFGKKLLSNGIEAETIDEWCKDPQVSYAPSGKRESIFDILEDTDIEECFDRMMEIHKENEKESESKNSAFVFIKPHANTKAVQLVVTNKLMESKIQILSQGSINGSVIDRKKLIDQHYYAIASKATILSPRQIPVPAGKFQDHFGESWNTVLNDNRAANAMQACERFRCTPAQLNEAWGKCTNVTKFGGGFYCGRLSVNNSKNDEDYSPLSLYVFNAFFMAMRSKFVGKSNSIYYFEVKWSPSSLSWSDFRGKVLGPTDPSMAPAGSIRQIIFEKYALLGLKDKPNKGDNGVHASASPLEGLAEKANWLGVSYEEDPFGKVLLDNGIEQRTLDDWCKDPQVRLPGGRKGSIFDALEDTNAEACLKKMIEINSLNGPRRIL